MIPPKSSEIFDFSESKLRSGFGLIELLVVIVIMAILLAVLLPVGRSVIANSKISQCGNNLRQMGAALNLYAGENNGFYPSFPTSSDVSAGAYTVCDVLGDGTARWKYFGVLYGDGYLTDPRVFYCPTARTGFFDYPSQWGAKAKGSNAFSSLPRIGYYQRIVDSTFPVPGRLSATEGKLRVVMTDANSSENSQHPETTNSIPTSRKRGINVLFNDGHVKYDRSGLCWNQPGQWAYGQWEANP